VDDEIQLVEKLQEFCRRQRKQVEVFFDNAPPGGVRARNYGLVIARFVRQGSSADTAIRERLRRLGRAARNWTVVSSDRDVQASARAVQARYLPSQDFAALMMQSLGESKGDIGEAEQVVMKPDELSDWLELFAADEGE
jgi:predicted RNA-binding protein with PIN domain